MKLRYSLFIFAAVLLTLLSALTLSGCSDPGNEPVKDQSKAINNNQQAMEKQFRNGGGGGAPAPPAR